jgi:hypothetical protein
LGLLAVQEEAMESERNSSKEEQEFVEFRRKVRSAEILSAAMERLLWALRFTGRVSIVMQNGRVLKSGYEEGYFTHRGEMGTDVLAGIGHTAPSPAVMAGQAEREARST